MRKKKSNKQKLVSGNQFVHARLAIAQKRLRIEEEKVLQERRLVNKHFGAILTAFVSFAALLISVGQIYITKNLGEQQAQLLREQEQRQSQVQQDQVTMTRALKDIEQETRAKDNSLKLAQFLVDNQAELFSADASTRKRMETILFATFDPHVIVPVLERLKDVQFIPDSQEKLEVLLNTAKELEVQNKGLQARNDSQQRVFTPSLSPTEISGYTSQRVALVIGNGAYEQVLLRNSVNDAKDMASALRELGFDVIYSENVNQKDMKRTVRAFGEKLRSSKGVGLFYYAGHGVQLNGINYLIPIDAKVQAPAEVEFEGVDVGFILAQMEEANNSMNIVILDACRNNPFGSSFRSLSQQGLAVINAPSGTLIAYSTAPGYVAFDGNQRNGVYTQELLKYIRIPGLSLEEVFKRVRVSVRNLTQGKQTPWESSSLMGYFYFAGKNGAL